MYIDKSNQHEDHEIIQRLIRSYRLSVECANDLGQSLWAQVTDWNKDISATLLANDADRASEVFRNPMASNLFYGFEPIFLWKRSRQSQDEIDLEAQSASSIIQAIGSVVGPLRINNPEAPEHNPPLNVRDTEVIDAVLASLDETIRFPNPFEGECGIEYKNHCVSVRAAQALYQTIRVDQLAKASRCESILEIGAGLGRSAYFAYSAGYKSYCIIDIPLTAACQAYFLATTLGNDAVCLFGEPSRSDVIQILPPSSLPDVTADLTVNVDSITEMDRSVAQAYVNHALQSSKALFKINHEVNSFRTADLLLDSKAISSLRYPCPIRPGYIEDIVFLR